LSSANQSTPHFHHGYWRFDFTVQTSSNNLIFERNDPPLQPGTNVWQAQPFEIRRLRDPIRIQPTGSHPGAPTPHRRQSRSPR
jgi:hypothetical protein